MQAPVDVHLLWLFACCFGHRNRGSAKSVDIFHISAATKRHCIVCVQAVVRWLESPRYPGRTDERSLSEILPHVRFAMMTPDQLCELERSALVERFAALFAGHIHRAYKYHSLSLTARAAMREFAAPTFLLRNYTETRWDKRLVIHGYSTYSRCSEVSHANSHNKDSLTKFLQVKFYSGGQ